MVQLLLTALLSLHAEAAALPAGLCPFDPAKVAQNFSAAIRRDYSDAFISAAFQRRERWYGKCQGAVEDGDGQWTVSYGDADALLRLDFSGKKIEQYEFLAVDWKKDGWEKFARFLQKEFPRAGFVVKRQKEAPLSSLRENDLFAIGDGHTLLLMAALQRAIHRKEVSPTQKVALQGSDIAYDGDDLSGEKPGFQESVAGLQERVFTRLDRTAADMVLRLLGREKLDKERPAAAPFLSNRQTAWLMTLPEDKMKALTREQLLATATKLDRKGKIPPMIAERYDHLEKVEWQGNADELCDAIFELAPVQAFRDGIASKNFRENHRGWKQAVYHAGREFGVVQTALLAQPNRKAPPVCFSLLINEPKMIDESESIEIHERALTLLKAEK